MNTVTFTGQPVTQPAPQTKQAIVGTLPMVESLMREFVAELAPRDRLTIQLTFSRFLVWLRKKAEAETNGD
jgi:hypothetical protein